MRTPAWRRLAFICFEDPNALNKVWVRLALLEAPKMQPGSLSLGFSRGQRQSQSISLPSDCLQASTVFQVRVSVFLVLHMWNLCRTNRPNICGIWSVAELLTDDGHLVVLGKTKLLSMNSGFWLLWIFSFSSSACALPPTSDVN